jgi:predicted transglutaminase-like cysteine proteinase
MPFPQQPTPGTDAFVSGNFRRAAIAVASAVLLSGSSLVDAPPDLGFTTKVSANLISHYARKFGPATPDHLGEWIGFAKGQKVSPYVRRLEASRDRGAGALQIVNDAINQQVKWEDDNTHWGVEDYWATPAESVGSAGGDCEDYSIAKYYLLKELGVPLERLRITYVRALKLNGQAHMVLAYYATPDADPMILDNLDAKVKSASQRDDLEPVYSFNDDELQLVQGGLRGKPAQIRAWLAVQQRLVAESKI